jgi:hypothetical protein
MGTPMIREQYEHFLTSLEGRTVRIDFDSRRDALYVFSEERWHAEMEEKPRTFAVNSGVRLDILLSNGQIYGAEIDDFQAELFKHGEYQQISWWNGLPKDELINVDGHDLVAALQHASLV